MKFDEYLLCAEKHLYGCYQLLLSYQQGTANDRNVWLELYYLSGYIIEGIVVYSAYKINNWNPKDDIKKVCNLNFSQSTNLDFYYQRQPGIDKKGNKIPAYFQNRPYGSLSVQGHRFQEIAKTLLKPDPSFNDVPYIGYGKIDNDIEQLIDDWKPNVRYHYYGMSSKMPTLNHDVIARLLATCCLIYTKHI